MPPNLSLMSIEIDEHTVKSLIVINNTTISDEGFYTCYGENGIPNVIDSPENATVEFFVQGLLF